MITDIITRLKAAGAKSESNTVNDGFLSWHAESHAAGMGIAAGYMATAHSQYDLLGVIYGVAVYGKAKGFNGDRRRLLVDIKQEPHYALGGIVLGALLGLLVNAAGAGGAIPSEVIPHV